MLQSIQNILKSCNSGGFCDERQAKDRKQYFAVKLKMNRISTVKECDARMLNRITNADYPEKN